MEKSIKVALLAAGVLAAVPCMVAAEEGKESAAPNNSAASESGNAQSGTPAAPSSREAEIESLKKAIEELQKRVMDLEKEKKAESDKPVEPVPAVPEPTPTPPPPPPPRGPPGARAGPALPFCRTSVSWGILSAALETRERFRAAGARTWRNWKSRSRMP